jgi:hypothetical protein
LKLLVDELSTKFTRVCQELRLLVYPSGIDLSTASLRHLSRELSGHRHGIGTRWRRLTPGRQALLVLAHLRCGDTYAQLAAGFGVGIATVYRYVREAIEVLAALAPSLAEAMQTASRLAFVILDGTLLPIDRIAADTPYYSGKHKRHGMNIQVLTDPFGRLLWASPALPGATHDLTAARTHGIDGQLLQSDAAAPCSNYRTGKSLPPCRTKGRAARIITGVPCYGASLGRAAGEGPDRGHVRASCPICR